jgi:hypothetical protein
MAGHRDYPSGRDRCGGKSLHMLLGNGMRSPSFHFGYADVVDHFERLVIIPGI